MTRWDVRLISELDAADERARGLVGGLSAEQLNWQPASGGWSVGQCMEHLCITNEVYLPPMAGALESKKKQTVEDIRPGWFGRYFLRNFVEPAPNLKRVPAPKKIVRSAKVETSVLERFLTSNRATRDLIGRAGEYDVNKIRFRNPLIAVIWFTVGTGLEIVSGHERRHLLQAYRVKALPDFPR
ncbi:MAG TPA: DinB family protein [Candidatus Acidoferrum sp.]|nr:DinB family protein [Candidatus Acidoferrum sp.]